MQWSLFLILLTGPCSFFACQNYGYQYLDQKMTWDEARAFCRENHRDLAKVYDKADMERLLVSTNAQEEAWIGLKSEPNEGMMWHWSLPGKECDEMKLNNTDERHEFCGVKRKNDTWEAVGCNRSCRVICYKEKTCSGKSQYYLSNKTMEWPEAQTYCSKYTDLVSGGSQYNDSQVRQEIDSNRYGCDQCWFINRFIDNWKRKWSNGSSYWDTNHTCAHPDKERYAVTVLNGEGKWKKADCNDKKPFFCYDDKMILIKENKTWEEALDFCRKNFTDLVSITDHHQQDLVRKRLLTASTSHVWVGLRYSCFLDMWFWVSDQRVCYENWRHDGKFEECDMAGTIVKDGFKWESKSNETRFNFICAV